MSPVTWRPWTGDPTSVLQMGLTRKREGARERWWILAGELPSPDSVVSPMVSDGQLPKALVVQGRLWAREWTGQPSTAEVTVDGKMAFVTDFRRKLYNPCPRLTDDSHGQSVRVRDTSPGFLTGCTAACSCCVPKCFVAGLLDAVKSRYA